MIITQPGTQTKGPAVVAVTVFNNGDTDQTLDAVRVAGAGDAQLTPASGKGKLTIPANGSLIIGGKGNASAALPDLGESVQDGNAQKVTFTFSKDGDVSLRAYVVPAESYFDKWGPSSIPGAAGAPAPTATATAGESGKPEQSQAPSDSASGSPAGSSAAACSGP